MKITTYTANIKFSHIASLLNPEDKSSLKFVQLLRKMRDYNFNDDGFVILRKMFNEQQIEHAGKLTDDTIPNVEQELENSLYVKLIRKVAYRLNQV